MSILATNVAKKILNKALELFNYFSVDDQGHLYVNLINLIKNLMMNDNTPRYNVFLFQTWIQISDTMELMINVIDSVFGTQGKLEVIPYVREKKSDICVILA